MEPTGPLLGTTLHIFGVCPPAGIHADPTVNVFELADPFAVVTVIGPVSAPLGTVTVIVVEVKLPEAWAFPVKAIERGGTKPLPSITTVVPTEPEFGSMLVIVGEAVVAAKRDSEPEARDATILPCVAGDMEELPFSHATNDTRLTRRTTPAPKNFKTIPKEKKARPTAKAHDAT